MVQFSGSTIKITEEFLIEWGRKIGNDPPHMVAKTILNRLAMPHWAAELTRDGQPIPPEKAPVDARNAALNPADLPRPSQPAAGIRRHF